MRKPAAHSPARPAGPRPRTTTGSSARHSWWETTAITLRHPCQGSSARALELPGVLGDGSEPPEPDAQPQVQKKSRPGEWGRQGVRWESRARPWAPPPRGMPQQTRNTRHAARSRNRQHTTAEGQGVSWDCVLGSKGRAGCPGWGEPHDQPSGQCEALGAKDSLPLSPHPALGDMVSVAQFARLQPLCNQEARRPVAQANPAWRQSHEPGDPTWTQASPSRSSCPSHPKLPD